MSAKSNFAETPAILPRPDFRFAGRIERVEVEIPEPAQHAQRQAEKLREPAPAK